MMIEAENGGFRSQTADTAAGMIHIEDNNINITIDNAATELMIPRNAHSGWQTIKPIPIIPD